MAKLKLKSVQNSTRDNVSLMNIGGIYFDESGNWVDESGNSVERGTLVIAGGSGDFYMGIIPQFKIPVTWDSGSVELPFSPGSHSPCVSVTFGNAILEKPYGNYVNLNGPTDLTIHWLDPVNADVLFPYVISENNGSSYAGHVTGLFTIPYTFVPPEDSNNNTK